MGIRGLGLTQNAIERDFLSNATYKHAPAANMTSSFHMQNVITSNYVKTFYLFTALSVTQCNREKMFWALYQTANQFKIISFVYIKHRIGVL